MPQNNLTKRELKRIIQALCMAIDWQDTTIDSYRIEWSKKRIGGQWVKTFPKDRELRSYIFQCKRDVKAFQKILKKIKIIIRGR